MLKSHGSDRANGYLDDVLERRGEVAAVGSGGESMRARMGKEVAVAPPMFEGKETRGDDGAGRVGRSGEAATERESRKKRMLALVKPGMKERREFLENQDAPPNAGGAAWPVGGGIPPLVSNTGTEARGQVTPVEPGGFEDPHGCMSERCRGIMEEANSTIMCVGSQDQSGWSISYTHAVVGVLAQDIAVQAARICGEEAPVGFCRETLERDLANLRQSRDANIASTRSQLGGVWRVADGPSGRGGWSAFWASSGCDVPSWYSMTRS